MQLRIDDTSTDKAASDVISEIDESLLDEDKLPPSAMERERNDIVKVKKVCKCLFELVLSMMMSKLIVFIVRFDLIAYHSLSARN